MTLPDYRAKPGRPDLSTLYDIPEAPAHPADDLLISASGAERWFGVKHSTITQRVRRGVLAPVTNGAAGIKYYRLSDVLRGPNRR